MALGACDESESSEKSCDDSPESCDPERWTLISLTFLVTTSISRFLLVSGGCGVVSLSTYIKIIIMTIYLSANTNPDTIGSVIVSPDSKEPLIQGMLSTQNYCGV